MTQATDYTTRYAHLSAQHAYELRVRAFGLSALLAPYAQPRPVQVPTQRVA